jgi:hypothetical protein
MPDRRRPAAARDRSLAVRVALAAAAALVLTGCGGHGTAATKTPTTHSTTHPTTHPSSTTPTVRPAPAPAAGVCRRLSFRAIGRFSNASRGVACGSSTYTAYTYAVKPLPRRLSGPIDSDAVQNAAKVSCVRSFARFIGGSPAVRTMSRLSPTYFLPTAVQFAAGTRWVRCDVIALQTDHRLAPLPPRVKHLLDDSAEAARFALCARGAPGSAGTKLVMCTQPHTYRAVGAIRLGGPDVPRPTISQLATPKAKCRQTVASLLGVNGGFSFVFTYPGVREWNAGQRFGLCWDRSAG